MARNTRRRAAQQRSRKVLDILNGVAENQENGGHSHARDLEQHMDAASVDNDHGDSQRQTRRSARLNKRTAREATPAPINNTAEHPGSPSLVPDHEPEEEGEDEIDEADEADEAEDDREVEEDGDFVDSEEDISMPDHEQQLWHEQERAIAHSQQEQQQQQGLDELLPTSPVEVVIDRSIERIREEGGTTVRAVENEYAPSNANRNNFFGGDEKFADSGSEQEEGHAQRAETQQEYENDEEPASDDSFDMNDSRHDVGSALQAMYKEDLFDWPVETTQPTKPVQRTRLVDQLQTQLPQLNQSPSRKRKRASNNIADEPDKTRRRIEIQNNNRIAARRKTPHGLPGDLEVAPSPEMPDRTHRHREPPNQHTQSSPRREPPMARGSLPEIADWEVTILEKGTQDEIIVVGERITFDDATKIQGLQETWKRLISYCQKLKHREVRRMHRYVGIEAIVERISDLLKDYKRMQRTRSRGRAIDANTWKRTRQEVKYISEDADKIRNVVLRRAKEGKERNDLQAQADAVEYAELIVSQVMTSLCELALECLRTYYCEEDEWLLNGGFGAVLDIIDIVGELDLTLTSLHNCSMVVLSPYPGRPIRQELRSIRGSLKNAEADEQRQGR